MVSCHTQINLMIMPVDEEIQTASIEDGAKIGWELLRKGEMKGLEMVYTGMVDDMYRYGMGIHSNSAFVKDCIQEIFVGLWKYRSTLKQTENVKAYLFKSLGNRIRREVGLDRGAYSLNELENDERTGWVDSIEDEWLREQKKEQLNKKMIKAMERLPPRQREAVELFFFKELPYEEVSATMNLHVRSVYTLVWKALTSLRKHMAAGLTGFFGLMG